MRKLLAALLVVLLSFAPAVATINFPGVLDDNTTLFNIVNGDTYIAPMHNNPKDAILALEAKVGVDGSAVATSLDYKLTNPASVDPGHTHSGSGITFSDGSAGTPGIFFASDVDTGFFRPGANIIAISNGGVETARFSTTGVGIFTTAFFPLDLAGTLRLQGSSALCFGGTGGADNDTCIARSAAHVLSVTGSVKAADVATTDDTMVLTGIAAKTGNFLRILLVSGDANPAVSIDSSGKLQFGAGGASAVDTNLYRSAANVLKTDDSLTVDGSLVTMNNDSGGVISIVAGTANGLKIGTATAQKLGFFNATPVVQQTASTALTTVLSNLGLLASGAYSGDITTTGTVTTGGLVGTEQAFTAANGANNNIALNAGTTSLRVSGPSGAFNITGFTGGTSGRILYVYSTVSQTLTWTNDATSTAANRIFTQTLADIACNATEPASATFVYDGAASRWRAVSYANCTNP